MPSERIRRRPDFQRVYDQGARINGRFGTVFILRRDDVAAPTRLGIAATKKLGGAVIRNRAKRLIREVFRLNKIAPGFDIVVIPKRGLFDAGLNVVETEYRNLLERRLPYANPKR